MIYYKVDIETSEEGIEIVVGKLLAMGIENTEVADPKDVADIMNKKESYEWDYIEDDVVKKMEEAPRVTIYTEEEQQVHDAKTAMEELAKDVADGLFGADLDLGTLKVTVSKEDDGQWKDKWKEYFKPFRVSDRIVIRPSWEELPEELADADIVIQIDPGMAFGTGTHETTSMCIQMLEKHLVRDMKVLDAGCGSGILSIAAAKLGADEVMGVDIDETAVEVAQENLVKNGVDHVARARYGDVTQGVPFHGDLVVANLMAELVCLITPDVPKHLKDGGVYITSGILVEKRPMVEEAITKVGFDIVEVAEKGEWCCIAARLPEEHVVLKRRQF